MSILVSATYLGLERQTKTRLRSYDIIILRCTLYPQPSSTLTPNPGRVTSMKEREREKATESAWRDNLDKVMARINRKDLGQILIKETTADTNDVFNVLIQRGIAGKGWGKGQGWLALRRSG